MSVYQEIISEDLAKAGLIGRYDPRHVEAWMRIGHGTLDHLSRKQFAAEIPICAGCIDDAGIERSERLAETMVVK